MPVKTIKVDELVAAASRIGVTLHPCPPEDGSVVYMWATPEGEVLYIGKSASARRVREEENFRKLEHRWHVYSAIVPLLAENHAQVHTFLYDPATGFDPEKVRAAISTDEWSWSGPAFDVLTGWLDDGKQLEVGYQLEQFLIRVAVRTGAPIGNAQFASQWEGPINTVSDTLAVLALAHADEGDANISR